jgi:hypothetical protein
VKTLSSVFMVVILLATCSEAIDKKILKPIRYPSPTGHYKRDSLYIATTIWQFVDKKIYPFDFVKQYNIPLELIRFDVDTIIYNPDSLKLFSFVIECAPESEEINKKNPSYYYSEYTIIGFRDSLTQPWKIYCGDLYVSLLETYNDNRESFRKYYFNKFKYDSDYYWDSIKQERIAIKYKYNLNDPNFWDSSIVWKKGSRIPGLYAFQTTGNVKPGDENAVKIIPHLDYPDSLLKLYR